MVLLEAMAAGKPIISTEVGDIPQVIQSGYSGLLVPAGNANALAISLQYLIDNRSEAEKLSKMARKEVEKRFSNDAMVDQYIIEYDKILSLKSKN